MLVYIREINLFDKTQHPTYIHAISFLSKNTILHIRDLISRLKYSKILIFKSFKFFGF